MQAHLHAIGGMPDHIHMLLRLPATRTLAQVAQDIKGASSHFATHLLDCKDFRWQGAYWAFGVDRDGMDAVIDYIENQKQHHAQNSIRNGWELPDE